MLAFDASGVSGALLGWTFGGMRIRGFARAALSPGALVPSALEANVVREPTEDPALEGFVIRQDPPGGGRAPQGSAVTIVVGQFTP